MCECECILHVHIYISSLYRGINTSYLQGVEMYNATFICLCIFGGLRYLLWLFLENKEMAVTVVSSSFILSVCNHERYLYPLVSSSLSQ